MNTIVVDGMWMAIMFKVNSILIMSHYYICEWPWFK